MAFEDVEEKNFFANQILLFFKRRRRLRLTVNEDKTKLIVWKNREAIRLRRHGNVDNYSFEQFQYSHTNVKRLSLNTKQRSILANRSHFGLNKNLRNKITSDELKSLYTKLLYCKTSVIIWREGIDIRAGRYGFV